MSTASPSLIAQLAQRARYMSLDQVPPAVIRQAQWCVLDTLGCILAGADTEESRLLAGYCDAFQSHGGAGLRSLVSQHVYPLSQAVLLHGYLGDVLELNDLIGGHASIGNVTAALALAESVQASQRDLIEAVIQGVESTASVYQLVYPQLKRFTDSAMVPVGIPSAIGAAAAASRLLQLSVEQTSHAMAMAAATSGWCPAEVIFGDGGTIKPILFGAQPALTGINAAYYARQGMTGPLRILESPLGYVASCSHNTNPALRPETDWALQSPRRKLHACCGYIHAAADTTVVLRQALVAGQRLSIRVPANTAEVIVKKQLPRSANEARFDLRYCVAHILSGADVIEPGHSIRYQDYVNDPKFRQAMDRITVEADPALTHYEQCVLELHSSNGAPSQTYPHVSTRGSPQRPLTEEELTAKFLLLSRSLLSPERARNVMHKLLDDDFQRPCEDWLRHLRQ